MANKAKCGLSEKDGERLANLLRTVRHVLVATSTDDSVSGADLVEAVAFWASENDVSIEDVDRLVEALDGEE